MGQRTPRGVRRILYHKLRHDLARRRWQFLAVLVTIVLGVTMFGGSFDAYRNLDASYRRTYERLHFADLTISAGDQASIAATARGTRGVSAVTERTQADVPLRMGDGTKLFGRVVGLPTTRDPAVDRVEILDGRGLDPSRPRGVLAETHLADHYGLTPGDRVQVTLGENQVEVTVLGIVASPEYLWPARSRQDVFATAEDFGVLFVPEALAASAPESARVEQVLVRYRAGIDPVRLDRTLTRAATSAGAAEVLTRAEQPSNAALSEDVQGFGQLSFLFPLLFLAAAALAAVVLLNRIVHSARAEIGTMQANGIDRRTVQRHVRAYGLVVGTAGGVLGAGLGVALGFVVTGAYTSALSIPDTVRRFWPLTPLAGIAFGVGAGWLAAAAPARAAARLTPAEAMRGQVPSGRPRASLVERLVPPLARVPVRWRMALRGVGRNPRRSVSTGLGIVLAMTLVLASGGMIDTFTVLLDEQFTTIQHDDAQVYVSTGVTDHLLAEIAAVPGVERTERVVTMPAGLAGPDGLYATQLQSFPSNTRMHSFIAADGSTRRLPSDGVLLGESLRALIGATTGATLTLELPALATSTRVRVAGFIDEPLGTFAYASRGYLDHVLADADPAVSPDALQTPTISTVMVTERPTADADTVRHRLNARPETVAVVSTSALRDLLDQFLGFFYAFVGVMLAFGAVMAFALVFNTISVNVSERVVEIATLRANGLAARQASRMLTAENVLLTALAIPVGLGVGWLTARFMLASYSSDLWSFSLRMRWFTPVVVAVAMLLVTLASQRPLTGVLRRLDIARVARERAR